MWIEISATPIIHAVLKTETSTWQKFMKLITNIIFMITTLLGVNQHKFSKSMCTQCTFLKRIMDNFLTFARNEIENVETIIHAGCQHCIAIDWMPFDAPHPSPWT